MLRIARSMKNSVVNLRQPLGRLVAALRSQPDMSHAMSYSAAGEDRFVLSWLQVAYQLYDASTARYCDIGAAHPSELNNTYLFYTRGASGVLIEPDPAQAAVLREKRPRDTILNVGVAFDERRRATLKKFTSPVFNTFSADQANIVLESSKNWDPSQRQQIVDEVDVPLMPINEILEAHFRDGQIHFMSIDTEGVDFLILQSIDFNRFRPKMICTELSRPTADIDALLKPHGYEFVARSPDNAIYRLV